jgi:hypothetical protein
MAAERTATMVATSVGMGFGCAEMGICACSWLGAEGTSEGVRAWATMLRVSGEDFDFSYFSFVEDFLFLHTHS